MLKFMLISTFLVDFQRFHLESFSGGGGLSTKKFGGAYDKLIGSATTM